MSLRMVQRFCLLPTALLSVMLSAPAKATPPSEALFGQIDGTQVALYAAPSSMGVCVKLEIQKPGQPWFEARQWECGIDQAKIDAKGGPVGYIEYLRPDINATLKAIFSGSVGQSVEGQLNTALSTAFRFSGAALVPRP